MKSTPTQTLVYVCNALDGSPIGKARVRLWEHYYDTDWHWRDRELTTNDDGICVFSFAQTANNRELFATAALEDRQAFGQGNSYWYRPEPERWRIYAVTDRPAYRPGETVQWKYTARQYDGATYSTPANQLVEFTIYDPKGSKVTDGKQTLNAFGSAWGSLPLTSAMPLGEYRVEFFDKGRVHGIGSATLFRLEEYKLPEFTVSVKTPEENGKKLAYRLGEPVQVTIQADYYFGGPVANATAEVLVYQSPYYRWWMPTHDYPWYYEDLAPNARRYYGGEGSIVKKATLKTDASGKATLTFDTPESSGQDLQYRIEARVTDSSRREIVGSSTVRVTRQRYYVNLQPEHYLSHPRESVTVNVNAKDANDGPMQVEGTMSVTRDVWVETWVSPIGREVSGAELRRFTDTGRFPPSEAPGPGWRVKFRGYTHEPVLMRTVKTDAEGAATLSFTPEREGYYRVSWGSKDTDGAPITSETMVWVADSTCTSLGYNRDGLEIIVDKDTFRAGQTAAVMLVAPTNDRYVLFSVEGEDLYSYQLVHMTGTVKLIQLPIEEKHVPNIFLNAAMVSDHQFYTDTKQVVVPPTKQFLQLDITSDSAQYQPRDTGLFLVTARDADGKPVSAEITFSAVDESVFAIQSDYAGDPRQFFYGTKRQHAVQTTGTMQQRAYVKLVKADKERILDEDQWRREQLSGPIVRTFDDSGVVGYEDRLSVTDGIVPVQSYLSAGRAMDATKSVSGPTGAAGAIGAPMAPTVMHQAAKNSAGDTRSSGVEPTVVVRSDFRSTLSWVPDLVTGNDGKASLKVNFSDALTGWTVTARAATATNQFGIASTTVRTKQPLIVRLQAPRFFVVGDTAIVSAVINNNTDVAMTVTPILTLGGVALEAGEQGARAATTVPANGETRIDWPVTAAHAGEVKITVSAKGSAYADAMVKSYPVYEHGIDKLVAKSGKARGNDVAVTLNLPKARKADTTTLSVQLTPSMAVTMLDALPYLIDYPYGCTEQTMSRFLPAAVTAKTLQDLGLKPADIAGKLFGGIEAASAEKTHPNAKHDLAELAAINTQSLARLYDFQHGDGGWGWWKEGDSDHYMTAYVVWGLSLAQNAGIPVKASVLERGVAYLDNELVEEETHYDMQAWMLHALSTYHRVAQRNLIPTYEEKAFANLWTHRDKLNTYTRALLALSAFRYRYAEQAKTLADNLANGAIIDKTPDTSVVMEGEQASHAAVIGTAHWGADGVYWHWSDSGVEATAFVLRALLAINPKNTLIEPTTNWLIKNRRGAQWNNTRDTAITVLALNDYLRASGELEANARYEVTVNGHRVADFKVTPADVLTAPSRFAVERKYLQDGNNVIRIRRTAGESPIYFAAEARFFSLEEPVTPAGNEIFVRRQYFKLVSRPTLLKGTVYDRVPLLDGESVTSGERVQVVLTIDAKNDYEYLLFEDLKPAGLEAVQLRSGEDCTARELKSGAVDRKFVAGKLDRDESDYTGRTRWVYQELRDRNVALFLDKLPQGVWEIRYDLRAEVPGAFHALPVIGQAMYTPEVRCNGSEIRLKVLDRP
jgi:hypothetical protein